MHTGRRGRRGFQRNTNLNIVIVYCLIVQPFPGIMLWLKLADEERQMRKVLPFVATVFTVFALFQSGNAETISQVSHYSGYSPDLVRYTVSSGHMPLVLLGNPFSKEEVLANLSLPQYLPKASFKVLPPAAAGTARLVLSFDGGEHFDGSAACRSPAAHVADPASPEMLVWAAFCYRDEVLAEGRLALPRRDTLNGDSFSIAAARLLDDVLTSERRMVERD